MGDPQGSAPRPLQPLRIAEEAKFLPEGGGDATLGVRRDNVLRREVAGVPRRSVPVATARRMRSASRSRGARRRSMPSEWHRSSFGGAVTASGHARTLSLRMSLQAMRKGTPLPRSPRNEGSRKDGASSSPTGLKSRYPVPSRAPGGAAVCCVLQLPGSASAEALPVASRRGGSSTRGCPSWVLGHGIAVALGPVVLLASRPAGT